MRAFLESAAAEDAARRANTEAAEGLPYELGALLPALARAGIDLSTPLRDSLQLRPRRAGEARGSGGFGGDASGRERGGGGRWEGEGGGAARARVVAASRKPLPPGAREPPAWGDLAVVSVGDVCEAGYARLRRPPPAPAGGSASGGSSGSSGSSTISSSRGGGSGTDDATDDDDGGDAVVESLLAELHAWVSRMTRRRSYFPAGGPGNINNSITAARGGGGGRSGRSGNGGLGGIGGELDDVGESAAAGRFARTARSVACVVSDDPRVLSRLPCVQLSGVGLVVVASGWGGAGGGGEAAAGDAGGVWLPWDAVRQGWFLDGSSRLGASLAEKQGWPGAHKRAAPRGGGLRGRRGLARGGP
jgi:hypothetical protein